MTAILTADEMRLLERQAIESGSVTELELMERAGAAVVGAIQQWRPALLASPEHRSASILCGPGNNGGDGFVVGRLLHQLGFKVSVYLFGDAAKLPRSAKHNFDRWCDLGSVISLTHLTPTLQKATPDLVVDALFGTGVKRALPKELTRALEGLLGSVPTQNIVAIDAVSGLDLDSGTFFRSPEQPSADAALPKAGLTVTFEFPKLGHYLNQGPQLSGELVVKSIGLLAKEESQSRGLSDAAVLAPFRCARSIGSLQSLLLKGPDGHAFGHKYDHGHAIVVSGASGQTGAARLASRAALRVGAGLVTVLSPSDALSEHAAQLNAVMLRPVDRLPELLDVLQDRRLNAVALGPGLQRRGTTPSQTQEWVLAVLAAGKSTVLDADALTAFEEDADSLLAALHPGCVLTPHLGEFARLFPDLAAPLQQTPSRGPVFSKVDATRGAADRAGCTVLLKGAATVISNPLGAVSVHSACYDRAAPWLATAGAGDVLAGLIVGLMARGHDPDVAAELGTWLHTEAALAFGPGLIAEDLPEQLPRVFATLAAADTGKVLGRP